MNSHELLTVAGWIAAGKAQYNPCGLDEWRDCKVVSIDSDFNRYRCKSQPREWWLFLPPNSRSSTLYSVAQSKPLYFDELIHVREVLEP